MASTFSLLCFQRPRGRGPATHHGSEVGQLTNVRIALFVTLDSHRQSPMTAHHCTHVTHHGRELRQLACQLGRKILHGVLLAISHAAEHVLRFPGPPDLGPHQRHHAQVLLDPSSPVTVCNTQHTDEKVYRQANK
eukprot:scaffold229273_cov19-Tisochrysis_lutea.AAC.3